MTIVLDRPITVWSKKFHSQTTNQLFFTTQQQYIKQYVNLILQDFHFISLHSNNINYIETTYKKHFLSALILNKLKTTYKIKSGFLSPFTDR